MSSPQTSLGSVVNILYSKEEEARNFFKSQGLYRGGGGRDQNFTKFQSLGRSLNYCFKSQGLYSGRSSEFFQIPEPLWRRQLEEWHLAPPFARCFANRLYSKWKEARNFSKSQGLYRGGKIGIFLKSQKYEEIWRILWRKYEEMWRKGPTIH